MNRSAPLQSNDPNQDLREQAINLYIAGERPSVICRRLGRSRTWFYHTLKRYQRAGRAGLVSQSRAPKRVSNRTDEAVEAAIVRVRQAIMAGDEPVLRYANIGAEMIASELQRAKMTPPSRATIHRILRRHHLVQVRSRSPLKRRLPADYPWPCVKRPNALHLLDFVIRAGAGVRRFYSCHLLDQARRWPFLRIIKAKQVAEVSQFLISGWQEIGLPGALYLDNDVVWAGSSCAPRTISHIVRLCLLLGVEVIFIPPYTPQANPIIESFNRLWDRNFWQRTTFEAVPHLEQELTLFENYCRYHRPLAELAGWTADQLDPTFEPCPLVATFDQQQKRLPLTAGLIHFIRFVDSEGLFTILNETWSLPPKLADKTIRATVDTQQQRLLVYHQPGPDTSCHLVTEFDYPLAEKVIALSSEYIRPHVPLWSVNSSFDC